MRILDLVIAELNTFRVPADKHDAVSALELVKSLLDRLDTAHKLYPTLKAFHNDKPASTSPTFQSRCDTLHTWFTALETIIHHIQLLQRWTDSDALNIAQSDNSVDDSIHSKFVEGWSNITVGSTFVDRVGKENTLRRTFERGTLKSVHGVISTARDC